MHEKKPVIGITCKVRDYNVFGEEEQFNLCGAYYLKAIAAAGGIPVMLTPQISNVPDIVSMFDGLVLQGGLDIHPQLYGNEQYPKTKPGSYERDVFEIKLVKKVLQKKIPLLGVCRGIQILNVALGGTLIQDIEDMSPGALRHSQIAKPSVPTHKVTLERDTLIHKIFGKRILDVNSYHHQKVGKLGRGLSVTGMAEDGTIEAVELKEHQWVLAVQWHPECMLEHSQLFRSLVRAAKSA